MYVIFVKRKTKNVFNEWYLNMTHQSKKSIFREIYYLGFVDKQSCYHDYNVYLKVKIMYF